MSNSSHPHSRSGVPPAATANSKLKLAVGGVTSGHKVTGPGTFDDADAVRQVLVASIKRSGLTRMVIAERMTYLLGKTVTETMLNAFTADRDDRRWPADFDRAFCEATGDMSLLIDRVERAGLTIIGEEEKALLELGRAYLEQKRAAIKMAEIERDLSGGEK